MRTDKFFQVNRHGAFVACFLVFLGFLGSLNWSYLPLTEGWFVLAGKEISEGRLPYVDFYAYLPPVYYWLNAAVYYLFSNDVDAYRWLGLIIHSALMLLTYIIFLRWNPNRFVSALSSLFCMLLMISGNAFISYDFLYVMRLFSLLGFLLLFQGGRAKIFLGAVFLTLGALTKQSDGSVFYLFGFFMLMILSGHRIEKILLFLLATAITCTVVFIPFILEGSLMVVADALFIQASNNKVKGLHRSITGSVMDFFRSQVFNIY